MIESASNWVAVSGASDVLPGSTRAVSIRGDDIVVWRTERGQVQAWKNQCIHRGMRLSFGQVRGEQLMCRYHGWQFNRHGQCTRMPAQPNVEPAKTLCVSHYGCVESHDLIWVKLDDTDDTGCEIVISPAAMHTEWQFCKSLYVDIDIRQLRNLLREVNFPLMNAACTPENVEFVPEQHRQDSLIVAARYHGKQVDRIAMNLHEIDHNKSALHLCVLKTGDTSAQIARRLQLNHWARKLRWFLLNPNAEFNGTHPMKKAVQQAESILA